MTNNNGRQNALKDYVEVNVRVERFYEKYPEGRISTQLLSWENGIVVMKAEVYRSYQDSVPSATGHAYEKEGSTFINKTSALENCETSAVGRALALLGFEIKKSIASKEEVENAKLNQNNDSQQGKPISPKQVGLIKVKVKNLAMARQTTDEEVYKHLNVPDVTKLTSQQASKAIETLTKWEEQTGA